MNELAKDAAAIDVTDLLTRYSFDLGEFTVEQLVNAWLHNYPTKWIRLAVIEALYQGRYKAFSVEQILNLWSRRGRSLHRFNHEFERIICGRFPVSGSQSIHAHALNSVRSQPQPRPSDSSSSALSLPPTDRPREETSPISAFSPSPTDKSPIDRTMEDHPVAPTLERTTEHTAAQDPDQELPQADDRPSESSQQPSPHRSPVRPFQPSPSTDLGVLELGLARSSHREPIHQFTPLSESSGFYSKLRAVAHDVAIAEPEVDISHLTSARPDQENSEN
jgi:hypothetical protein